MLLTQRWFELPGVVSEHEVQTRLKDDLINKRNDNFIIAAGRRSFKTERFLKRFFIQQSVQCENRVHYLGAPTRSQAKEIFWNDIKALCHPFVVKHTNETELKITFVSGTTLKVVGLDAFKRVQGGMAHLVGLTEMQECDAGVYTESFEPMLNDTGGMLVAEGRPLGKNHLYDLYLKGVNKVSGWGAYHWKSSEILTAKQIERAKSNQSEADYAREYDASFETEYGNPYHSFTELNVKEHTYNPNLPVIVACDFNATENPMSWNLGQTVNENGMDVTYWFKSFSNQFTHTKMMCEIVDEWFKTLPVYPRRLNFYGDYAGNRKESNSSESDWQIIERYFASLVLFRKFLKPCKSIRNSISATNGRFQNALGQRRQFVSGQYCKPLIADFQKCQWKENSRELDDRDPLRGHSCRSVDYFNDYEYPILSNSNMVSIS